MPTPETARSLVRICRKLRLPFPRHDHSLEHGRWLYPVAPCAFCGGIHEKKQIGCPNMECEMQDDVSQTTLKPCPFCGSTNIDPEGWMSQETKGPACDDCGASAGNHLYSPERNIELWNRRDPPMEYADDN